MKKKFITFAVGALSLFTLAACSSNKTEDIATMKGGKITVEDFYNEAKTQQANQQLVQGMIINKVMSEKYGEKVTTKDIDAKFNEIKKQYGDSFDNVLKQSGLSEKTFKDQIKQSLALEKGMESHVKLTDEDYKTAWKSFHPEVEAQMIVASTEDDAKAILKEVKDDKKDFATVAKDKSVDTDTKEKGGTIKFDSQSEKVPQEVKTKAFALKDGEISDVITVASQYGNTFYIVKMVKNKEKGNSMDPYKKKLKKIATDNMLKDQAFATKVIQEELKEANVKIKDKAFDQVLAQYLTTTSSDKAATSDTKKEEKTSSDKKETKDSKTKDSKEEKTTDSTKK